MMHLTAEESRYAKLVEFDGKTILLIKNDALVMAQTFAGADVCIRFRKGGGVEIIPTMILGTRRTW